MKTKKSMTRVGYFGPEGTFTHEALDHLPAGTMRGATRAVPYATVAEVIRALETRAVDAAMVPIENSVEGAVTATLDGLAFGRGGVRIAAEVLLPIHFDLFTARGIGKARLREVHSHPHALAQCRKFILKRRVATRSTLSTAEACQRLRDHPRAGVGAIASSKAGALYGLTAAARGIEDVTDAVTRFVLLSRETPAATGSDKTSLVLTPKHDRPGSLVELLQEFSSRGINLTRIESRPLKTQLGRYCFFIDAEGHIDDAELGAAARGLSKKEMDVKFLGSYPNVGKVGEAGRRAGEDREKTGKGIKAVGIIGLGLIGGSLARALLRVEGIRVRGYDTDAKTRKDAAAAGIECVRTARGLAAGSELIVVATPGPVIEENFREMSRVLKPGQIVTDAGSVKMAVEEAARKFLPRGVFFIGGHPMAGSERPGFGSSRADLFTCSPWVLTFDEKTDGRAYLRIMELLLRLRARVVPMRAEIHDEIAAQISHLPHVIAYTLMSWANEPAGRAMRQELAAGSFRDMVRVSGAPPEAWTEICRMNAGQVRAALEGYGARLEGILSILNRGEFERLRKIFGEGHAGYRRLAESSLRKEKITIDKRTLARGMPGVLAKVAERSGRIEEMKAAGGRVVLGVSARR